ncbi:Exodeoxyribonuclease I [Kluyvera cryocrescens]|uniref:Exodeoxyribonuclease I n=1 Tax=Kluyvera cryocrescens TaxID=580 RepID=A0A485BSL5_KLUCR|nr:Exodeoxyribonuclease I [Kluyvera cryocrescens]
MKRPLPNASTIFFTVPETCVVGYNNVRFDDEVTRNIFYRNF